MQQIIRTTYIFVSVGCSEDNIYHLHVHISTLFSLIPKATAQMIMGI